jgi:hypothetical protein
MEAIENVDRKNFGHIAIDRSDCMGRQVLDVASLVLIGGCS